MKYPVTPDGRYFVVRGRLWRLANPSLPKETRAALTKELMAARRAVHTAKTTGDRDAETKAHHDVDDVKQALGERGAVWWDDGAADINRKTVRNSPYADWFAALKQRLDDDT